MRLSKLYLPAAIVLLSAVVTFAVRAERDSSSKVFVPLIQGPTVEFRGLWVSRFDWATAQSRFKIDEIVDNADAAGFNVLIFQVRGEADAYYTPGLEPWGKLLTGTLGQNPGWDPLARMINLAHQRGIQVHAYINVYPVWLGCGPPPDNTTPQHLYYDLISEYGLTGGKPNGFMWDTDSNVVCGTGVYLRATPASIYLDDHLIAVAADIVSRYNVDGIHLDHIRYDAVNTSCDPVSLCRYYYGSDSCSPVPACPLPGSADYAGWQRSQINGTVSKFYDQIIPMKPGLWLSAAVWPIYKDYWGWGTRTAYDYYYQDSKYWIQSGFIDTIMPMIYGSDFWTQSVWQTLVQDYQATSGGRFIIPGIGANHNNFSEIEARINMGRQIGTPGHAIFSYGEMNSRQYFDDLAQGPYAVPAIVPRIPWHP